MRNCEKCSRRSLFSVRVRTQGGYLYARTCLRHICWAKRKMKGGS